MTEIDSKQNPDSLKNNNKLWFSDIHYIITLIFFFLIFINIITLTFGTVNMNVPLNDNNLITAKNLMISSEVITYIGLFIILIFLGVTYSYISYKTPNYVDKLIGLTGGESIYEAMRIVTFSILMFISLIVSSLCLEASNYISKSDNFNNYKDQYNLTKDIGRLFMVHFILFTTVQGFSYLYSMYKK